MKQFLKDNWFKIALLIIILIGIIGYISYLNNAEKDKVSKDFNSNYQAILEKDVNAKALKDCLEKANSDYLINWNTECTINGTDSRKYGECTELPIWDVKVLDDRKNTDKQDCFKQYPQ